MNRLSFYTLDTDYCDYLRKYDNRVPYTMQQKSTRPFIGVILNVNNHKYYAPLSSPKQKHLKMKNQVDFIKIKGGYWGVINLNNMIPVIDKMATKVNPNNLHRSYDNEAYKNLLNNQLSWCNGNKNLIIQKANNLYTKITTGTAPENLLARCCDFKLLEQESQNYILMSQQTQSTESILPNQISNIGSQDFGGFTQGNI